MKKLFACLLAFITAGNLMEEVLSNPCQSSGFDGCQCNILGACGITPTDPMLKGYAPSGLENLSFGDRLPTNVAYLCEGGTVAIMYDCNKRIPLYSATMMEGWQLDGGKVIRPSTFTSSNDALLHKEYQQSNSDYFGSSNVEVCYDTQLGDRKVEFQWYNSLNPGKTLPSRTPACDLFNGVKKTAIHRGHLIAASYGRGDPKRISATFTYTNVVPQFGPFNSGPWCSSEQRIQWWGRNYCTSHNKKATKNVNVYIIVGVVSHPHSVPVIQDTLEAPVIKPRALVITSVASTASTYRVNCGPQPVVRSSLMATELGRMGHVIRLFGGKTTQAKNSVKRVQISISFFIH